MAKKEASKDYDYSGVYLPPRNVYEELERYRLQDPFNLFLNGNFPHFLSEASVHSQIGRLIESGMLEQGATALTRAGIRAELIRLDGGHILTYDECKKVPTILEFASQALFEASTSANPVPLSEIKTDYPFAAIHVECSFRAYRGARIWEATLVASRVV